MSADDPAQHGAAPAHAGALERGPGRATAFTDAVVAVAMTALVLPLLDINLTAASTFSSLWDESGTAITSMLLSFFIIAVYWLVHHRMWFLVRSVNSLLLWLNFAWLLGIVLIPFGTVLMYEVDGFPTLGFQVYAGLICYVSLTLGLQSYLIRSRSSINIGGVAPERLLFSLRYAGWWLLVTIACVIDAEGVGRTLLAWSALPMIALGYWRRTPT